MLKLSRFPSATPWPPDGIYQRDSRFMQKLAHSDLRFGDDLDCTFFKRAQCEFRPASGHPGADHHGHRHFRHDFLNESEAIHARHFEVGNDDIGRFLLHLSPCNEGIRRGVDVDPAVRTQDGLHDLADHRGVIATMTCNSSPCILGMLFRSAGLLRARSHRDSFIPCLRSWCRWSAPGCEAGSTRCSSSRRGPRTESH